jgi:hypothetical protein
MNREVHVRIWERPEVRVLRATRQRPLSSPVNGTAGLPSTPETRSGPRPLRLVPFPDVEKVPCELHFLSLGSLIGSSRRECALAISGAHAQAFCAAFTTAPALSHSSALNEGLDKGWGRPLGQIAFAP